ncbi:cysteine hydrolase [Devosia sp. YIM 151766]|nr:cysteine hydrolase [Devosia sp. YIM 151766]WIY54512.1 cysteine hydrolase [Devosia sp. YIM 151766]
MDRNWVHICVDMQSLFAEETDWHAPWLKRILPAVEELVAASAPRTIFTRFLPPETVESAGGGWRRYYERWPGMVRRNLAPGLLDLVPSLARFVPPAHLFDKAIYSPWLSGALHNALRARGITSVVISGGETDICVLATVMGAIDLGYHVVLPIDALFGSADATHDATLEIYKNRFQTQLTIASVEDLVQLWQEQAS